MRYAVIAVCCLGLAGCAGGAPESACQIFAPLPVESPTAQGDPRTQSTGDPAIDNAADARDC